MPFITEAGARIYWRCDGRDDAPPLLLANSLGCDHALWEPVLAPLVRRFRVIRYDMRGHAASDTSPGEYALERLARDALAVADAACAARFHFAGVSLGGMVGMWVGANAPDRVDRLALLHTSAFFGPEGMAARIAAVKSGGMPAVADAVLGRFFTAGYVERADPAFQSVRRTLLSLDPSGYAACCAAIRDMDLRSSLGRIRAPTIVFAGTHDQSTPPEKGREIVAGIAGSGYVEFPCAHIPFHEVTSAFVSRLAGFLAPDRADTREARYTKGIGRRREALGAAYVDKRLADRHPFTDDFQDLISRFAWGEIWTRPVFSDRERRLLVLAQTVALRAWEEFELHARAGLAREVSPTDLKELLLLTAVYSGVPAANTAFAKARKLVEEAGGA